MTGGPPAGRRGGWLWLQQPIQADDLVPFMYAKGMSRDECVERLRHRFRPGTIAACWVKEHKSRGDRRAAVAAVVSYLPAPRSHPAPAAIERPTRRPALSADDRHAALLRRATLEHLLDLKRAGHSPRVTELPIRSDDGLPRVLRPAAMMSLCGSSAAMAADL